MKTIAALVAAVALLGQAAQALTPTDPSIDRLTLQSDPSTNTTNTTGTDGVVNVGDDDGTELISPLLPETATSVSLLADSSANSVPWSFKLAAQQSAPGRELVAAPTTRECPAFARTARNVLIAVSSCFTKTTYTQIDEWVKSLKKNDIRYFPDDANAVGYEVRWVHDGCAKPDWSNLELKCDSDGDYVGVISITVYKKAADTVAQFIAGKNLPPPIGYVYNGPTSLKVKNSNTAVVTAASTKVRTSYDGYKVVEWNDVDKGFMCHTDLLENLRKVHCATLPGSKASLFVSGSTRKCFCSCADDSEFVGNECKPKPKDEDCTCLWSTSKNGYTFEVKTSGSVCSVANAGTLPVPIIGDNYVDRFRANNGDFVNPLTSPRITLIKERNAVTLSGHGKRTQDTGALVSTPYTWKDFQSATNSPVNSLVFDQLGQYKIELQAFDYNSNATCPGCVLVVDSFRPTHHSNYPCPAPLTDTVAEFSSAAVAKYREAVQRFKNFSAFALNDGCSLDSRCDAETKRTKAFVEGYYGSSVPSADGSAAFFDEAVVKADLKAKLSGGSVAASGEVTKCSASTSGSVAGCVEDICMRCIDVSSELKEWWVDYNCGSTVANAKCEGKEPACVLKQCLTVNATSIFTGSAQLKETVRNASLAVLKAKEENKNKTDTAIAFEFQMGSTVHIALVKCTDFNASDPNCVYSTKISDLIDTSVSKVAGGLFTDDEVKGFVTWRYSVDNVNWKPLTTTTLETFTQAKKEIKVEAWSKCGLVNKFSFNVALHLNNKIEVCDKFPSMWYQTTTPTTVLLDKTSEVCMHPKSDFAEVTFDYKPNIGLRTGTLEMTISGVSCTIKYADSTGNATIVSVTKAPYEIIKEFAIDGVKFHTTDAVTKVEVACTFTYTRTLDKATESQVCSRSLVIKDCTPPTITKPCPFQDKCDFSKCAKARKGQPDIYQACAGNRISQTSTGAATITTANATCCESCAGSDYTTLCRPLRASPSGATSDGLFIGRCDAEKTTTTTTTTGSYTTPSSPYASAYSQYAPLAMLQAAANGSISAPGAASSALLGASALVAVVALVAVARRRARAELAVVEEDAYYPLMG